CLRQSVPTFSERKKPCVFTMQPKNIKSVEPNGNLAAHFVARPLQLHALLQLGEARHGPIEGHDFSIHGKCIRRLAAERLHQFGIFRVEPFLIPRQKFDVAVGTRNQATNTVELRLEQPSLARKRTMTQRREHRSDPITAGRACCRSVKQIEQEPDSAKIAQLAKKLNASAR